jgi:predicted transcriptional regulator of viral defense system
MSVAQSIIQKIDKIPERIPFGYTELNVTSANFFTVAKAIERLQKKGIIKKISKGQFYKPSQTVFGELGPDYSLVLNNYLFKNNKRVAYITGGGLYNALQLTTQQSFTITIATNQSQKKINVAWGKTKMVKAYVKITDKNYTYLGVLDAIKDVKKIADTSTNKVIELLINKLKSYTTSEMMFIIKLALQYPARVRALLGAMVESINVRKFDTAALKESLNPSTTFNVGTTIIDFQLLNNWNIK